MAIDAAQSPSRAGGRAAPAMRIDAIVPARNAEAFIGICVAALGRAGFAGSEVIVVDDASSDGTAAAARRAGATLVRLDRNAGASAARNAGAARSRADILLFVDADVAVHADVRARIAATFERHADLDAVFGSYDANPTRPERVSRFRNLLHHWVHQTAPAETASFWTGCGAVRREAFERIGGFDPAQAFMEDIKFGMALHGAGGRIRLDRGLLCTHMKCWSLPGMLRTDLLHRAIPWSRLLLSPNAEKWPNSLNVDAVGRLSVLGVAAGLACLAAAPVFLPALWGWGLSIVLVGIVNRRFVAFLARRGETAVALAAPALLWLHYLCGGLGFAWVLWRDRILAGLAAGVRRVRSLIVKGRGC